MDVFCLATKLNDVVFLAIQYRKAKNHTQTLCLIQTF
jgi:hypothetical protein